LGIRVCNIGQVVDEIGQFDGLGTWVQYSKRVASSLSSIAGVHCNPSQ
jgi:hypothetical protein